MNYTAPLEKSVFWELFLKTIKESVNIQSFNTWFKPLSLIEHTKDKIIISVPKAYFSSWLEEHYMPLLKSASSTILGYDVSFSFISKEDADKKEVLDKTVDSFPETNINILKQENKDFNSDVFKQLSINPRFTFDSFVVGTSNQFAFAASKAVADAPGTTAFNPLVIYSGVGLGKTHLLQAIAFNCLNPKKSESKTNQVIYVSSEKFTMDFIISIQKKYPANAFKVL